MSNMSIDNPVVQAIGPEDLNTAANDGTYVNMRNYRSMEIWVQIGDVAGGAAAVTVEQATSHAAAGEKAVSFTKYYQTGQKLKFTTQSGTFSVGETITGGSSSNTASIIKISSAHLIIATISGSTTWTDGETITGGTSGATAVVDGTGEAEDTMVEKVASSNTFSTLAVTFKQYMIPIDAEMLDVAGGFDWVHVKIGQAAVGSTIGGAFYVMKQPRQRVYPQVTCLDDFKIV